MLAGLYNQAVAVAANTSLGKAYGVKPQLEAYLTISDQVLLKAKSKLTQVESLQTVPNLKDTLTELANAAEALLKDVRAESNMNKIVDIIANHIRDFDSVTAFTEALPKMDSIKTMQAFGNKLIDLDNYEQLGNLLSDLQDFSNLKTPDQKEAFAELSANKLLNKITAENAKLNINQVKKDVKKMTNDVCKELKLTESESDSLIALFDTLTTKHLPALNSLRQKLIKELPAFLAAEKQRIAKAHPELVVTEHKPSAILAGFHAKPSKAAKRKAENAVGKTVKVAKKGHLPK